MSRRSSLPSAWRLARLTGLLAPLVLLTLVFGGYIQDRTPEWVYWQAGLVFLIAMEGVYVGTAAAAILGALASGLLLARPGGRPARRAIAARGLLLCLSIGASLAVAEAAVTLRSGRSRRSPEITAESLRAVADHDVVWNMPGTDAEVHVPTGFADGPDDPAIDVVILGESSAEGVPFNEWVSMAGILEWRLGEALPGRPVRVKVLASSGETLRIQHEKLGGLKRRPELMIVYCGHNEFSARFHVARDTRYYLDERIPSTWEGFRDRLEATSPLCGLIRRTADRFRVAIPPPPDGRRAAVDVPACTSAEREAVLEDFRRRLESIVADAEQLGALPVLILPPANDAGFEPNRSYLPPETPRAERRAFERDFLAARRAEAVDPDAARAAYRALLDRQPGFSEAHYRLARLLERAGEWDEAYRHDVLARDLDGFPMRCPTPFQEAYREVAARHDCIFIDGQAYFHAIGRHGLLDDGLFQDAMHPSLRGQIAMAQAVLRGLWARRAFGWPADAPEPILDPERLADHFAVKSAVWRRICLWGILFYTRCAHARYDPSTRLEKKLTYAVAAERIQAGAAPESLGLANIGTPEPVPAVDLGFPADRSAD